jgi:hypothetical protein|tara:strand:- start:394 stop:756 length:363 start_codon:yes stop_codon:yes gene_type:complete
MRDLSKPLAATFGKPKRRVQIKTPTYEQGSGKRLSMAKNTVVGDRKGNIKKTRGVQKSGGMKSVSKKNYKTGKEVSRTRKTVGAKIRTAARKAGVGQNKGQRSMSTAKTGLGENGYPIRK